MSKFLKIEGAKENNLKNISLNIEHDTLTVVTGLSGSGKSSLAFDTVYAEGQRRYIETFSPYTRQFFDKVKKPDVERISGVRPAVAIQQKTRINNSRSTVGSLTNINEYLKVIWTNLSKPACPECGFLLERWNGAKGALYVDSLFSLFPEAVLLLGFEIPNNKEIKIIKEELQEKGVSRVFDRKTGEIFPLEEATNTNCIAILDRINLKSFKKRRTAEAVEEAQNLSSGRAVLLRLQKERRAYKKYSAVGENKEIPTGNFVSYVFSREYECEGSNIKIPRPRPALFSFNHPYGACEECKGFGRILTLDLKKAIPDHKASLNEGAIQVWTGDASAWERKYLQRFCEAQNINQNVPWKDLPQEEKDKILYTDTKKFTGVVPWFKWIEKKAYKMHVRVFLARYREQKTCPSCKGARLKKEALSFKVRGLSLPDIWSLPLDTFYAWAKEVEQSIKGRNDSRELLESLHSLIARIDYLISVGLPYLTLERNAKTLSGGETQRVNLATALGSDLTGTHFVLDEPTVGLHAQDTLRLLTAIQKLTDKGNSLLVVEHDPLVIRGADTIIEIGPKAGSEAGEVMYDGRASKWDFTRLDFSPPKSALKSSFKDFLTIKGVNTRNLKNFDLQIPLSSFSTLIGVSGSGKSTFVEEVLVKEFEAFKETQKTNVQGFEKISSVVLVDQSALSKSPRANIATYSDVWEVVRDLLSNTDAAKQRALSKSSFSFNVNAGRCTTCNGAGFIKEDMQFLSDVYMLCEVCLGKRFQTPVLEVQWNGKNVDEILHLTVLDAINFFSDYEKIIEPLKILSSLGLGHLMLGHSLSEMSGGESQRLKLIPYLSKAQSKENHLFIFDEPTTGLHPKDVEKLAQLFIFLRDKGHTILCVEHNLDLISTSDWVIELGPVGGEKGGYKIFEGTFDALKKAKTPTSEALKAPKSISHERRNKNLSKNLKIIGAREHNLKDITLEIPSDKIVTLTGASGSGKSTVAKDIIFAEGQRQYLDCLSPYARQFIKELKKPEIDSIQNVKPTICVHQHTFQPGKLSTVGTLSESYNFLRLLYAKVGKQYCPSHPEIEISQSTPEQIAVDIKETYSDQIRILAPIIKLKKGFHKDVFKRAIDSEVIEVRVDGLYLSPRLVSYDLDRHKAHSIDFVVAKCNPKNVDSEILSEAISQALTLSGGTLIVTSNKHEDRVYSSERACSVCKRGFLKPDPEDFSFSSKRGACKKCTGTGVAKDGSICKSCKGAKLSEVGRTVKISNFSISELCDKNISETLSFFKHVLFTKNERKIAETILEELLIRLSTLSSVGLDYLTLNRSCKTLSGGELQRLRLSAAMGTPLSGVMYIFDEPSIGLHPKDNEKILSQLRSIQEGGNSVILIEHDPQTIKFSDYVIDMGPSGGKHGGEIIFEGDTHSFLASEAITAQSLRDKSLEASETLEKPKEFLHLKNAHLNTIKDLECSIPLKTLTVVGGVSGSGKSTLIHGIIGSLISQSSKSKTSFKGEVGELQSDLPIEEVILVDQKPIGQTSRSTPASYLGVWDEIRKVFAETIEAKTRGFTASFFSYNSGQGRCPECKGLGFIKLEMSFLPDANIECEVCEGARYTEAAQEILFKGVSVSQILEMTFEEAKTLFINFRKIREPLHYACELGLGYLTLGQHSNTLSGGESQRLKLVSELMAKDKGHMLYLLDEPTTGLHRADIRRLIQFLRKLVARGSTVLLIEHDDLVIKSADYLIEMGPGAGALGGKIVYSGDPRGLSKAKTAWGEVLREESDAVQKPVSVRKLKSAAV